MTRYYAAIDTETTGLDASKHHLLQVAAYVTDDKYEPLDEGIDIVIRFTPEEVVVIRENTIPYVQEMHAKTALWEKLTSSSALPLEEADERLYAYLTKFDAEALYMLGNSITLDRNFMEVFLPKSFAALHYRSVDVTSLKLFLEDVVGEEVVNSWRAPDAEVAHEAKADILNALKQVQYYSSVVNTALEL